MRIVIDVVASGDEAKKIRHQTDPFDDLVAADGQTVFIQEPDGRLRAAYLQLKELEGLPQLSIVKVRVTD